MIQKILKLEDFLLPIFSAATVSANLTRVLPISANSEITSTLFNIPRAARLRSAEQMFVPLRRQLIRLSLFPFLELEGNFLFLKKRKCI